MGKKVGIWMDKRTAKIVSIDQGGEFVSTIDSGVDEFHPKGGSGTSMKGGPQDVVQDSRYTEREKHQMKAFFNEVMGSLPECDSLVVFGPAQTGQRFMDELSSKHKALSSKAAGVEKADSMTDNQAIAWVRDYFRKA
jgi:hypothetical protein